MNLICESHFPETKPEGLVVGFFPGAFKRAKESPEFKDFAFALLSPIKDQYYRTTPEGYFRNPIEYTIALQGFLKEHSIAEKDVIAFGSSRGATMALFLGWTLGIRAVMAGGPQMDILADNSYIDRFGTGPNIAEHRTVGADWFIQALFRSVQDKQMTYEQFYSALESLDLRHVLMRSDIDFPRTYILLGKDNKEDQYPLPGIIEAAKARKAPLEIRFFPGYQHSVLTPFRNSYLKWLRAIWDGKDFETPGEKHVVC